VVGVDLDRGAVVTTVPVTKAAAQGHLGVTDGRVWVLLGDGSALVGIDVTTGERGVEVALGVRGTDLVAADGSVWVVSAVDDAVVRVDTTTGTVGWQAPVGAVALALGPDGTLWVGGRTTTRLDADTGEVLGTIPDAGPGADGSLAADDDGIWVRSQAAFLRHLGPDGEVLASHDADVTSGGDVLIAHGAVWTTAYDDAALFRITP
jgi:streptogramin lyase